MMMKNYAYILLILVLISCGGKKNKPETEKILIPQVTEQGTKIVFPNAEAAGAFKVEKIASGSLNAQLTAPAKVSATILKSNEGAGQNLVLFENPDLAANYTQLIQHQININQIQNVNVKQKQIELDRIKDLQQHGAATGKDLLEAQTALSMEQTNLANEKAAIIEHETKLKAAGFNPEELRNAGAGMAYVICDIPENQISKISQGSACTLQFSSFPGEKFNGKIDAIADVIDASTRMVKLRINVNNTDGKLKSGMFAAVYFDLNEGNNTSISKTSIITVQGKNYVFIKSSPTTFIRREISAAQQFGERIIVLSGINAGDEVVTDGVMQLKGLSFGY